MTKRIFLQTYGCQMNERDAEEVLGMLTKRVARGLLRRLLPQPVAARHAEYSMMFSADDDPGGPLPMPREFP